MSNTVKNWKGYEKIADKLQKIPQKAYDEAYKAFAPQDDGFNVITHGDLFINNLLFRHDQNGNPIDIRLVSVKTLFFGADLILINLFLRLTFQLVCT